MNAEDKKKLFEIYKGDKRMLQLILKIEESKLNLFTHVILPTFMISTALVLVFAVSIKLIVEG